MPYQSVCAPWATPEMACSSCQVAEGVLDPVLVDDSLLLASEVLFNLTGGEWPGECTDVIRPVASDCQRLWRGLRGSGYFTTAVGGVLASAARGDWWSWAPDPSTFGQAEAHSSRFLSEIRLPSTPVTGIVQVLLDGAVLPATRYKVINRRSLILLPQPGDPWQGWPCCQDDHLPTTDPGTFEVAYTYGLGPPPGGVRAAAIYGCQLALSATPGQGCKLPERITSITRQGVSMAIIDPLTIINEGMVGLPAVDTWVNSVWARRKRRRASITALDVRKPTIREEQPEGS